MVRIRGYQYHSNTSVKTKKNPAAYQKFTSSTEAMPIKDVSKDDKTRIEGLGDEEWPIPSR